MAEAAGIVQQGLQGWGAGARQVVPSEGESAGQLLQESHTHTKHTPWGPGRARSQPPPHGKGRAPCWGPDHCSGKDPSLCWLVKC